MNKTHPVFDTLPDGVVSIDKNHIITYVNLTFQSLSGYSENELVGTELNQVIPREYHNSHTNHIEKFNKNEVNVRPMDLLGLKTFTMLSKDKKRLKVIITINKGQIDSTPGFTAVVRQVQNVPVYQVNDFVKTNIQDMRKINSSVKSFEEKILLIDDDPFILKYLKYVLKSYQVISCTNGVDALKKIENNRPDLIISDISMPMLDGYALVKKIKETPNLRSIPLIFLTANLEHDQKLKGLDQGADYFLTKPVNSEEIKIVIKNLLEKRKDYRIERLTENISVEIKTDIMEKDKLFLKQYSQFIESNLSDSNFNIDDIAKFCKITRRSLERKVKKLTGISPYQSILLTRLNIARKIKLKEPGIPNKILAQRVGYNDFKYFLKIFKSMFGVSLNDLDKNS